MSFIVRITSIVLLLLLASCSKEPTPPMMLGAGFAPGYEPLYLAQEQGFLKGVNLKLAEYAGTEEVKKALLARKLHAAAMPLGEAVNLLHDIPDLKIVLLLDYSNGADAVLAQPGIANLKQLQGRSVGVENMGRDSYFLHLALKSAGMGDGQVKTATLPIAEQLTAFKAHKLDAVVASGAARLDLLDAGGKPLFDSSRTPGKLLDVLVVRDNDIGNYHYDLSMLVRAWQRTLDFIRAQPDQAMQSMAKREKLDPARFKEAMQGVELLDVQHNHDLMEGGQPAVAPAVEAIQRFLLERGLINMGADASALLDTTLLPRE